MHVNPKHKWCMKKNNLVKNLEIENLSVSIGRALINCQSSHVDSNQNFYRIFDRSSNRFDQSKIWKTWIFEKQIILMRKLLKAHCFMNKMHEYDMKSFSKTLGFNPNLEYWSLHNSDLDHQHPIATSSRKLTTTTTWQLQVHRLLLSWIHRKHKYSHLCIIKLFMQQPNWSSSSWHNLDSW